MELACDVWQIFPGLSKDAQVVYHSLLLVAFWDYALAQVYAGWPRFSSCRSYNGRLNFQLIASTAVV